MISHDLLAVLLILSVVAATHRLTRLLVLDVFPPIKAFRGLVYRTVGQQHPISYLVGCFWCASVWIGCAVTLSAWLLAGDGLPYPWGVWALSSSVAGILGNVDYHGEGDPDE